MEGHHYEVSVFLLMVEYAAGASDEEVHYYNLNLKEGSSNGWLTRLPSIAKNGVRFRHAIVYAFVVLYYI